MSNESTISNDSMIVVSQEQASSEVDGEAVILNLKSGYYYSTNAVASRIWDLIQEPKTVEEVHKILLSEYEVEPEMCNIELLKLLEKLEHENLIDVRNDAKTLK